MRGDSEVSETPGAGGAPARQPRFTIAARLTTILTGVALSTVILAGIVDDRALSLWLQRSAEDRLAVAMRASEHLLAGHLHDLVVRYRAVSRTPEFRAHLEVRSDPTMRRLAASLAERMEASEVAFLDAGHQLRAHAGERSRVDRLVELWRGASESLACVAVADEGGPTGPVAGGPADAGFSRCSAPLEGGPSGALLVRDGMAHAAAALPLRTGSRAVGWLLVAEPIRPELLEGWSGLVGARVEIATRASDAPMAPRGRAIGLGDWELRATISSGPEAELLKESRHNQLLAGLFSILLALALSAYLARDFLRPIHEIREVTEAVGRGDLSPRIASRRGDEIGDVARVLDSTLESLMQSQRRLHNVQRAARFADWSLDLRSDVVEGSREFQDALGLPEGGPWTMGAVLRRFPPRERARFDTALRRCRHRATAIDLDLRREGERGELRIFHVQATPSGEGDEGRSIEGSLHDVTERRRAEEQIRFLAFHDGLTGLPNRRFLNERLALAVTPGQPQGFSLFFLDLDRFKLVNDTLGHSAGDELLRQLAGRLSRVTEEHPSATVARFGGDEFTLLFPAMTDESKQRAVARALLLEIARPFDLQGNEVVVTGSVGIACWPGDGESLEDITRSCDTALHQAKERGRNDYCLYDESMRRAADERWKLETRLRQAIDANRLEVYYQPRVAAEGHALAGFEALLRWHDAEFGGYRPADFVPIAEETGLIVPLGSWVVAEVVRQIADWQREGLAVPFVSVNLSGRQLQPELVGEVARLLEEHGVDAAHLEFEVTETAVIADAQVGIEVLGRLRALGIRVSLDDFGTGYSSLSYLRTLPISGVKIDGSFVRSIASDDQGLSLASSIVSMAKVVGLFVVAEGVETDEQAELLSEMGCDELQGYLFGEAGPHADAERRLRERRRRPKRRSRRSPAG